jgi:hypothetical protein
MKKHLLTAALCAFALPAYAQTVPDPTIYDPLHMCYTTGCSSFGGVTISTVGGSGLANWGVSSSPAPQSGVLFLALLVPNNEAETVQPTLSGTLNGNPLTIEAPVAEGTFSSGLDLTDILKAALGNGASPPNPFSAYSGATLLEDPTFTNYSVELFKVDGTFTTGADAGQVSTLDNSFSFTGGDYVSGLNTLAGIGPGAIITAFLVESGIDKKTGLPTIDVVSTAQSSSLLVTPSSAPPVPEASTWAMLLAGFGLMGLFGWRKRRASALAF